MLTATLLLVPAQVYAPGVLATLAGTSLLEPAQEYAPGV